MSEKWENMTTGERVWELLKRVEALEAKNNPESPAPERLGEWCKEHITERNNWFVTQSGKKIEIQSDWKFCPVCGKERPAERKGLAEILEATWFKHNSGSDETLYGALSKAALLWFRELVQSQRKELPSHADFYILDELLATLEREAGGGK